MNDKEGRKWLLQKLYNNGIQYIVFSKFYNGYVGVKEAPIFGSGGEPRNVINCIITLGDLLPDFNEPNYLDIGKYLGIVDWSEVAVDTPILIKKAENVIDKRHFAKFENNRVYFYDNGTTSWSFKGMTCVATKYAMLAGGDDEN